MAGYADDAGQYHDGRRVELNAFTSDQFIEWLEAKLRKHRVKRIIPDTKTLAEAYRRSIAWHELNAVIKRKLSEVMQAGKLAAVPKDLPKRIARELAKDSSMSWDEAIHRLSIQKKSSR